MKRYAVRERALRADVVFFSGATGRLRDNPRQAGGFYEEPWPVKGFRVIGGIPVFYPSVFRGVE